MASERRGFANGAPSATVGDCTGAILCNIIERFTRLISTKPNVSRSISCGEHSTDTRHISTSARQHRSDLAACGDSELDTGPARSGRIDGPNARRSGRRDTDCAPHGPDPTDRGFSRSSWCRDIRRRR